MRNYWLDKKKATETLSFADDHSKAVFWSNRDNRCVKSTLRKQPTSNNDTERVEDRGLTYKTDSEYGLSRNGVADDARELLKSYWRIRGVICIYESSYHGLVERLQTHINNGHWHWVEEQIIGMYNLAGKTITHEFCEKLKHFIAKIETKPKEMREQTLLEKLVDKVAPAEYATENRFEHEAKNRPYTYNLVQDIDLIRKHYREPGKRLAKLTTEDVKVARIVERVQEHIQDGSWHYYQEYLALKGYSKEWGDDFRDCIANIPPSNWREISREEVNAQRLAKQKTV